MMFNAAELVGNLMQGVLSGTSQNRIEHAFSSRGLGRPGGIFAQLLGSTPRVGDTGAGSLLGNVAEMATSMLGGAGQAVRSGNPLAIGGLGALAGALLGGGGGATRGALGGGAMALLGSLAMEALRGLSQPSTGNTPAASPSDLPLGLRTPTNADEEQALESKAMLILKAMVDAAKADGQIDDDEQQRILGKLDEAGADAEARAFVQAEMRRPLDLEGLLREIHDPQLAAEVYAASLLAIEVDTPAERQYLHQLAQGLGLDEGAVQRLHLTLGVV
jgi:uncharacterized membrane protein YebE (DUF533 family)